MSKKVLIVDDSKFQRGQLSKTLIASGYEVSEAGNGVEALQKIKAENFNLIVTDLLMPEMSGIELLKELSTNNNKTPIIVLTADIQEPVKQECLDLGAKAFLNKPFNSEILLTTLSKF